MRMPAELTERARSLLFGGDWTPPPTRAAATLVLMRDGASGLEVVLLDKALGFARGMHVFPGGAVEHSDAAHGDAWRIAAIRETFEECGVLIADPAPSGDLDRMRSEDFARVLDLLDVVPDECALHPFAHWVTPEIESRRFDTKFYAAAMPAGQQLAAVTSEHRSGGWFSPSDAVGLPMLPPTAAVLAELRRFATVAEVLKIARDPVPIMPRPVPGTGDEIDWVLVNERTGEPLP